ncbi:MAG: glycosyltransferase family 4 protein [Actinomycetaceae bacterium]|nr:glycosyltransferase family 4 protein [Arcanobacterium sp.]MDD7504391.1 glycosyltransferase family 4 protein [Actinomycetaceae bacterium]
MRIGFLVNNYPPHMGGVEIHVQNLAKELHRAGNDVYVFTLGDAYRVRYDDGVRVFELPKRLDIGGVFSLPSERSWQHVRRKITELGIDVISVHTRFFPLTWLGVAIGRWSGIPVVLTEHGSDFVVSDSALVTVASRLVDLTIGRWSMRSANKVLGVSPAVTRFVHRLSGVNAQVFYNAVVEPNAASHNLLHSPCDLMFVGRIVEGKGWRSFLRLAEQLHDDEPEVTATVIGTGPEYDLMRAVAPAWVKITGQIPHEDVIGRLAGATLVNPTMLSEGFQTTVVEAVVNGGRVVSYPEPAAVVLESEGAPVVVVPRGDEGALENATRQMLSAPPEQLGEAQTRKWLWPQRAQEYSRICVQLIQAK